METTFRRDRLRFVCSSMDSRAKACLSCLLQHVYSNSAANTLVPWGVVFGNMVTKSSLWTPQTPVICRIADTEFIKGACGADCTGPGRGEHSGSGKWEQDTGAWEHLDFQIGASCSAEEIVMEPLLAKESPISLTHHSCILYSVWRCVCFLPHSFSFSDFLIH